MGWIAHNDLDTASGIPYGVNLDIATGLVTGYAWSSGIGWIDFDPTVPGSFSPDYSVQYDPDTRKLSGWAQIVTLGDSGWLKFDDASFAGNGVTLECNNEFKGYAWNDTIGWVDYTSKKFGGGVQIGTDDVLDGYAWSDSVGFISFSGPGYSVSREGDGNLKGYAWSSNVGYINHDPLGPYPSGPVNSAKVEGGQVTGWAKIESLGDDGWIKYSGALHEVTVDGNGNLEGFAWSDTLGWIEFKNQTSSVKLEGEGSASLPKPVIDKPKNGVDLYFVYGSSYATPALDWEDITGTGVCAGTQKTYHVQIDDQSADGDFETPIYDQAVTSSGSAHTVLAGILDQFNQLYHWRVRVENTANIWSEWSHTTRELENSFRTPLHALPDASFTHDGGDDLPAGTDVQFTDTSIAYGGSQIVSWHWNFGDGFEVQCDRSGTISCTCMQSSEVVACPDFDDQNPVHTFNEEGDRSVTLTVRDSDNYEDTFILGIQVRKPLPEFDIISPR